MFEYQVIARKFRPQKFDDVYGQEAIITTLKNAIKFERLAQAYLFCGPRGTGKTTLARLLAKALNCLHRTENLDPCNTCSSCREISTSTSLDVIEIDGASHRGIDDIRQINETIGYTAASGGYKIYIIDEVHMLTKEAFNALLKTLEEPPPKVKFFFATTEAHKVLPTILSRCQRFNLNRIPFDQIFKKLKKITEQLNVTIEEDALFLIAKRAEGGLRDAESLLDQIIAFESGSITIESVTSILGIMPQDVFFEIDEAGKAGNLIKAFEITQRLFNEGKDLTYFIDGLMSHFRQILLLKLKDKDDSFYALDEKAKTAYENSSRLYTQEQCLDLIEYLITAQVELRTNTFSQIHLENILLHILRSHSRLPIEYLVRRLGELEQAIEQLPQTPPLPIVEHVVAPVVSASPLKSSVSETKKTSDSNSLEKFSIQSVSPTPVVAMTPVDKSLDLFVLEDPTPSPSDLRLPQKPVVKETTAQIRVTSVKEKPKTTETPTATSKMSGQLKHPLHYYDTLFQFAAIELEGKLQKN